MAPRGPRTGAAAGRGATAGSNSSGGAEGGKGSVGSTAGQAATGGSSGEGGSPGGSSAGGTSAGGVAGAAGAAGSGGAPEPVTWPTINGVQWADTAGNPIQAHGGGILKVEDDYYWFGENRNPDGTFYAVSAYRSRDLIRWEFVRHVLRETSGAGLDPANIERPKVIFNAATGKYVLWMHWEMAPITARRARPSRVPTASPATTSITAASARSPIAA